MAKRGRRPRTINPDNLIDVPDRVHPTEKSDEKVSYSDELPEFFKVYRPATCAESMKIPPDFIKKFGENIPKIVTFRGQFGKSWQVDVKRINDNWLFQEGWPEFVQENSLEDDDFLTFCYSGNSIFFVKIFTRNGCLRRVDWVNGKSIENLQGINEESDPGNCKENRATRRNLSPTSSITRRSMHGNPSSTGRNLSPTTSLTRRSMRRNPSFSVVLTRSYIRKGCLHVPKEFATLYMEKHKGGSRLVTLWIENNSWKVGLIFGFDRVQFSRGWLKFVKDNSLRSGNSCTFQLIHRNDLAFKVTVNR